VGVAPRARAWHVFSARGPLAPLRRLRARGGAPAPPAPRAAAAGAAAAAARSADEAAAAGPAACCAADATCVRPPGRASAARRARRAPRRAAQRRRRPGNPHETPSRPPPKTSRTRRSRLGGNETRAERRRLATHHGARIPRQVLPYPVVRARAGGRVEHGRSVRVPRPRPRACVRAFHHAHAALCRAAPPMAGRDGVRACVRAARPAERAATRDATRRCMQLPSRRRGGLARPRYAAQRGTNWRTGSANAARSSVTERRSRAQAAPTAGSRRGAAAALVSVQKKSAGKRGELNAGLGGRATHAAAAAAQRVCVGITGARWACRRARAGVLCALRSSCNAAAPADARGTA
jgi:hypothetical protein